MSWRRDVLPLGLLLVAVIIGVTAMAWAKGVGPLVIPVFLLTFMVGTQSRKAISVPATLLVSGTLFVSAWLTVGRGPLSREAIAFGLIALVAGAVGITAGDQRVLRVAAEERARRAEETREQHSLRRVAEERLRIARDLHDVVAHHIAVISVQAGAASQVLASDPIAAGKSLQAISDASGEVLDELHTMLGVLRAGRLESDATTGDARAPSPGLARIPALVETTRASGIKVKQTTMGRPRALPPAPDITAYRIVQEALTNAVKHGAGTAELTMTYDDEQLEITVTNPIGVAPSPNVSVEGYGLEGMTERAAAVGGTLTAATTPEGTFVVKVEIPLPLEAS